MHTYLQLIINDGKTHSQKQAIASLDSVPLVRPDALPTLNNIRDTYGLIFETSFWANTKTSVRDLTLPELIHIRVNPFAIMAGQYTVSLKRVKSLLRLSKKQFWQVVKAEHDPTQPIILIQTPHGYVSVNGHHRIRALQALNVRKVLLPVVPINSPVYSSVLDVFIEFGYVDTSFKRVYDGIIRDNSNELTPTRFKVKDNGTKEVQHVLSAGRWHTRPSDLNS